MIFENNVNLKKYNTFQVENTSKLFTKIKQPEDILELIQTNEFKKNNFFIL